MSTSKPHSTDPRKAELVLSQLDALPPLAPIAAKILALTDDSRTHARQIVELISADPPLTARVLSVLARAEHGIRAKAVTIENAVTLLGFSAIRQLTLALKVMDVFGSSASETREDEAFQRTEFWKHCLATACAAREIAAALPKFGLPDEAFVNGLLHDLGKIALDAAMPKTFARIVQMADESRGDIAEVERSLIGVDHAVVGHRLAEKWGLPQRLSECIWLHHQHPDGLPASIAAGGHVQIVQLADTLAREQRIGYSGNHAPAVSSRVLASRIGLPERERTRIVETLVDEIERRAAWIGEESLNTRQVYLHALMQTTEELTASNAELVERNHRLQRQRDYFTALQQLNRMVTPKSSVRDVCGIAAIILRTTLGVRSLHVHAATPDGYWNEWGICDASGFRTGVDERADESADRAADQEAAVALAGAGVWFAPPTGSLLASAERWRSQVGDGPLWLVPIIRERRWIGGALFAEAAARVTALRSEGAEIEALGSAIALAIEQTQTRAAAVRLSDELTEVNRRLGTIEGELLAARNLETVVNLAAGAAHEMNNPLAVIAGRAQMLLRREDRPDVRESLEIIARQAHGCSAIVTELMEFARSPEPRPESLDLRSIAEAATAELASAGLLAQSEVEMDLPSDTPRVLFDSTHLHGILRELIRNAVEATASGSRRLSIKAPPQPAENGVVIHVIDNGRGMTADVLGRAMEPFFSEKPAGRGRGLGLARVRRWLHQGGGRIRLDSEPGKGTIVELRLPAAART